MIALPEIDSLERAEGGLRLRFEVQGSLRYFAGHFAEVALLPGVVQVGWALELARLHLEEASDLGAFTALSAVKFMRVIQPGAAVTLRLALEQNHRALAFEYESDGYTCSSGRILFQ